MLKKILTALVVAITVVSVSACFPVFIPGGGHHGHHGHHGGR